MSTASVKSLAEKRVRRQKQFIAVGVPQLGQRPVMKSLGGFLPESDQRSDHVWLTEPLGRHMATAHSDLAAQGAHQVGRLSRRQWLRVDAAEDRDAIIVDDPAEDRVTHRQRARAAHLMDEAPLGGEQVAQRNPLSGDHIDYLPTESQACRCAASHARSGSER